MVVVTNHYSVAVGWYFDSIWKRLCRSAVCLYIILISYEKKQIQRNHTCYLLWADNFFYYFQNRSFNLYSSGICIDRGFFFLFELKNCLAVDGIRQNAWLHKFPDTYWNDFLHNTYSACPYTKAFYGQKA